VIGDIGKLRQRAHRNRVVRSGWSLHRSKPLDNSHGGSAIPRLGVTEEGPTDRKGRWRPEPPGRGDAANDDEQ